MKKILTILGCSLACIQVDASAENSSNRSLLFEGIEPQERSLVLPGGKLIEYLAYEKLYYVSHVEDSTYQFLNFYVPKKAVDIESAPIFLRTYIGGYMASKATSPSATDATGRALSEGYVVCIPGSRGANSSITTPTGETVYTGKAPNGLLDLKAAIRYLKLNNDRMAGDATKIIIDGTSAGGAMASLIGATGNHPVYDAYLKAMGAADTSDDVFAAVAYCPIIDLEHADMAYEWLYKHTNSGIRQLNDDQKEVSEELAAQYSAYLNGLLLRKEDGTLLTTENYMDYLKTFFIASLQRAQDEGALLPDTIGIVRYAPNKELQMAGPGNELDRLPPSFGPEGQMRRRIPRQSEFIEDLDMEKYLTYVASTQSLKNPPAFDSQGVLGANPSAENKVFGERNGDANNFTEYSVRRGTNHPDAELSEEMKKRVWMLNPMNFITDESAKKSSHWYIRHGLRDRDTGFQLSVNLTTLLRNQGFKVNFALPWNRPHAGDYNLNDLFSWINALVSEQKSEHSSLYLEEFTE
ncbi:MAG: subtype B tannase [Phocaeicola sp.]